MRVLGATECKTLLIAFFGGQSSHTYIFLDHPCACLPVYIYSWTLLLFVRAGDKQIVGVENVEENICVPLSVVRPLRGLVCHAVPQEFAHCTTRYLDVRAYLRLQRRRRICFWSKVLAATKTIIIKQMVGCCVTNYNNFFSNLLPHGLLFVITRMTPVLIRTSIRWSRCSRLCPGNNCSYLIPYVTYMLHISYQLCSYHICTHVGFDVVGVRLKPAPASLSYLRDLSDLTTKVWEAL